MDSPRIISFQAAAAYGIKPKATAPRLGAPIAAPISRSSEARNPFPGLVSGKVDSPVARGQGFDAPLAPTGSLQMYTRAADRVEVATAARLGRIVDTRA
jgi:hypothetical protein